jgi:hypothetical protein
MERNPGALSLSLKKDQIFHETCFNNAYTPQNTLSIQISGEKYIGLSAHIMRYMTCKFHIERPS